MCGTLKTLAGTSFLFLRVSTDLQARIPKEDELLGCLTVEPLLPWIEGVEVISDRLRVRLAKDRDVVHPVIFEELGVHEAGEELNAVRDAVVVVVPLCEPVEASVRHGRDAAAFLHADEFPRPAFRYPFTTVEIIIEVGESLLQEAFEDAQQRGVELGVVTPAADTDRELFMIR